MSLSVVSKGLLGVAGFRHNGLTGLLRRAVLGHIRGRSFDVVDGACCILDLGLGVGNLIGNGILASLAFKIYLCSARATVTCSCSSFLPRSGFELSDCCATDRQIIEECHAE